MEKDLETNSHPNSKSSANANILALKSHFQLQEAKAS